MYQEKKGWLQEYRSKIIVLRHFLCEMKSYWIQWKDRPVRNCYYVKASLTFLSRAIKGIIFNFKRLLPLNNSIKLWLGQNISIPLNQITFFIALISQSLISKETNIKSDRKLHNFILFHMMNGILKNVTDNHKRRRKILIYFFFHKYTHNFFDINYLHVFHFFLERNMYIIFWTPVHHLHFSLLSCIIIINCL